MRACQFVERRVAAEQGIVARDLLDAGGFRWGVARYAFNEAVGFTGTRIVFLAAARRWAAECDKEYAIEIVLAHDLCFNGSCNLLITKLV